jgi:hypothetical protein
VCSVVLVLLVRTTIHESLVYMVQRVHVQEHADVTSVVCSVVLVRTTLDESLVVHAWVQRVHVYCVWQRCSVQRFNRPHPFQSPSVQAQLYPLDRGKTLDLKH